MVKTNSLLLRTSGIVCTMVLVACLTANGCEPLRKKFVRKKRPETRTEVLPILDPQDYPAPEESPQQLYRQYYSLWKVWHKDLITAFEERGSDKRMLYLVDQLILQLQRMQELFAVDAGQQLENYMEQLNGVRRELQEVSALRNDYAIKSRVSRIDKDFRLNFSPQKVQDQL